MGGILNNKLLFSLLFYENFCGGRQGSDEGRQSRDMRIPQSPPHTRENPVNYMKISSANTEVMFGATFSLMCQA